jgi:hypothetical protein
MGVQPRDEASSYAYSYSEDAILGFKVFGVLMTILSGIYHDSVLALGFSI